MNKASITQADRYKRYEKPDDNSNRAQRSPKILEPAVTLVVW